MGLDLAARAVADGHEVRLANRLGGHATRDGDGFAGVTRVDDWRASMPWVGKDGLVFMTGNARWCREMDRFREFGFNIFGPTEASAALEIDRAKGLEAMKAAGIDVPEYQCFDSLKAAEKHARKSDKPYVFKTLGSEDDKALTFVANDPAEMCGWIGRQIALGRVLKGPCLLQEKIDMVAELGVSGWMGPDGFLPDKWQWCIEQKRLMSGDIGPQTGEMGTLTCYAEADRLAEEMLMPMEPILRTLGHRGDFAIGCGIDSSGKAWPFEFTARAGWPAFFNQTASHKGDVAKWTLDLLSGKDSLRVSYEPTISVVMAQPRFPYIGTPREQVEGNPITGLEDVWDDVHPAGVYIGKGPCMDGDKVAMAPCYLTSAELVLVVTGSGKTVSKAMKAAYDSVGEIGFSNAMYRDDIGECAEECLPKLQGFGYCEGVEF
jgi:phosphoribosylamine---glycine ligase